MPRTAAGKPTRTIALDRPHRDLTETEEEVADLASQMILYGGAREDVELLLTAVGRHRWRRFTFNRASREADIDKSGEAYVIETVADWFQRLSSRWRNKLQPRTSPENPNFSRTVTEMVRADIRRLVRRQLEDLLSNESGIETAWALNEILEWVNSGEDL